MKEDKRVNINDQGAEHDCPPGLFSIVGLAAFGITTITVLGLYLLFSVGNWIMVLNI